MSREGRAGSLAQLHTALVCWAISCSLHLWFHLLHSQFSLGGAKSCFVYSSLVGAALWPEFDSRSGKTLSASVLTGDFLFLLRSELYFASRSNAEGFLH